MQIACNKISNSDLSTLKITRSNKNNTMNMIAIPNINLANFIGCLTKSEIVTIS